MHGMLYYVPDMMKRFGNVEQFSGQGVPILYILYIYKPLQMNQESRRIMMMQGVTTGQAIVEMLL